MRASWGAAVTNRINELTAMAPSGMMTRDGTGGIGFQPLPTNHRGKTGGGSYVDRGVFRYSTYLSDSYGPDPVLVGQLTHCYWMEGGELKVMDDTDILDEDGVPAISDVYVCLKLHFSSGSGGPEIAVYDLLSGMIEDQGDYDCYVIPLYHLNETGSVDIDFRNMPQIQRFEEGQG